ncbi:MAG: hydrogenase nickel incorporation protein HypB [Oscillatoriaceae bacterium SKW80]|nr:hydrogenase nickel incorporation protein HypB [Oscillatoriaceae bacterium SKW80]
MCKDCGCSVVGEIGIHSHNHEHHHHHEHEHEHHHHEHEHEHHHHNHETSGNGSRMVAIAQSILDKNDRLAERNRGYFLAKGLLVLNLLSSPGSGKTALLERMIKDIGARLKIGVIVGDLETDNDAQRLRSVGNTSVVQITTGTVCHLEAEMVARAAKQLNLDGLQLLIIENVGNLVCPAVYDLGESLRVVILSVTEGEDKPLKYPTMFKSAHTIIVNKIDIAEVVGFDREKALTNIRKIAPQAKIFEVSARTGAGMDKWYSYLENEREKILSEMSLLL